MKATTAEPDTAQAILAAARERLLVDGYAGLSTRKVAQQAGVPLSQVHYHFGSKGGMVLALLESENRRRLARQTGMYAQKLPLWRRYEQACDFLEDDLESGYVRVLQEMIAAGWSTPEIAEAARTVLQGWYELLTEVATEAADHVRRPRAVRAGGGGDADRHRVHRIRGACCCSASTATNCRSGAASAAWPS